jgi:hypothetical protein
MADISYGARGIVSSAVKHRFPEGAGLNSRQAEIGKVAASTHVTGSALTKSSA